jgi:hypothetical protein
MGGPTLVPLRVGKVVKGRSVIGGACFAIELVVGGNCLIMLEVVGGNFITIVGVGVSSEKADMSSQVQAIVEKL